MNIFTERLDKAIRVAAWAHEQQGQHRKGTDIPYIIHPFGVMVIANSVTNDEDTLIACLLHDVLEDVDPALYSEDNMRKDFGDPVTSIVKDVSKDDSISDWTKRSEAYVAHLDATPNVQSLIVCAADKINNLSSVLYDYKIIGESVWDKFAKNNSKDQLWWYESILSLLHRRIPNSELTSQLESLILELRSVISAED